MRLSILLILAISVQTVSASPFDFEKLLHSKAQLSVPSPNDKKFYKKDAWSLLSKEVNENLALFNPTTGITDYKEKRKIRPSLKNMEDEKSKTKFNLWNIVSYHMFNNDLILYCPFYPDWVSFKDHGRLTYPVTAGYYGLGPTGSFDSDSVYWDFISNMEFFGWTDYYSAAIPIMSIDYPGEDSIDADGNVVYYPRQQFWYLDSDIKAYKLKESWVIDENNNLIRKEIDAIAPIVDIVDLQGNVMGEKILFWLDFKILNPILSTYRLPEKVANQPSDITYQKYFNERLFKPELLKMDSVHVDLIEN